MVERAMFGGAVILGLMAFVRSAEELVMLRALQGMITGTMSAANALVAALPLPFSIFLKPWFSKAGNYCCSRLYLIDFSEI